MNYRNLGLVMLGSLLAACASQQEDDSYTSWVCTGQKNSANWSCEMREFRDGQMVAVAPPVQEKAAPAVAQKEQPSDPIMEVAGFPSQQWRQQLPSLTNEPVLAPGENASEIKVNKARPPRVAEPIPTAWQTTAKPTSSAVDQPVVHTIADDSQPIRASDVTGARSGYTMQLGAFSDEPQLQAFVAAHSLANLPVRQFRSFSKEKYWQVLTWGEFESPDEARNAWNAIAKQYPGVEPWVRAVSSLDNAADAAAEVDG